MGYPGEPLCPRCGDAVSRCVCESVTDGKDLAYRVCGVCDSMLTAGSCGECGWSEGDKVYSATVTITPKNEEEEP